MNKDKTADVIIVGAGLCGLVASKILLDAGLNVLVLERGNKPGEKCSIGTVVYSHHLEGIFSKFWENKNNRIVNSRKAYILQDDNFTAFDWNETSEDSSTFFASFNKTVNSILTSEVQSSGGNILFGETARELIVQNGTVTGIKTDKNEYQSNIVVIAEGASAILSKLSGLRKGELTSEQSFLFFEEKIDLPIKEINKRFNIKEHEGCLIKLFVSLRDIKGTGFVTVNKDSVVLSIGARLSDLIKSNVNITEYFNMLKTHPSINPLINNGTVSNFSSFMLPSVNHDVNNVSLPTLYGNGYMVIGGATTLVDPFSFNVASLPIKTSKLAAGVIINSMKENNFSSKILSRYLHALKEDPSFNNFINTKNKSKEYSLYLTGSMEEENVEARHD